MTNINTKYAGAEEILNADDYAHNPGQIVGGSNFQVKVPPYDVRLFLFSASVELGGHAHFKVEAFHDQDGVEDPYAGA